jgi:hypothetical protein
MGISKRSVITIAVGLESYFDMAVTMSRSVQFFNPEMPVYIVTDRKRRPPRDLRNARIIVPEPPPEKGFASKLALDRYAQSDESLFLDSDCIVLGDVNPIFEAFRDKHVGAFGIEISQGEWFGDVAKIRQRLGLNNLIKLNGGAYFFRSSERTREIMDFARELVFQYDALGFVRLRNLPNEEVLIGAALSRYGELPVKNDGQYYADFQWWPVLKQFNPLKGQAFLTNPAPPHPLHQDKYPADEARPIIMHFLGHHAEGPPYRLAKASFALASRGMPFAGLLARGFVAHKVIALNLKIKLRPTYRKVFGVRPVRETRTRYLG